MLTRQVVLVARDFPSCEVVVTDTFESKAELIQLVLASTHIPFVSGTYRCRSAVSARDARVSVHAHACSPTCTICACVRVPGAAAYRCGDRLLTDAVSLRPKELQRLVRGDVKTVRTVAASSPRRCRTVAATAADPLHGRRAQPAPPIPSSPVRAGSPLVDPSWQRPCDTDSHGRRLVALDVADAYDTTDSAPASPISRCRRSPQQRSRLPNRRKLDAGTPA